MKVLQLSGTGTRPSPGFRWEQVVIHSMPPIRVRWETGGEMAVFHGGHNADHGRQSIITVNSIIGTKGVHQPL